MYNLLTLTIEFNNNILFRIKDNMMPVWLKLFNIYWILYYYIYKYYEYLLHTTTIFIIILILNFLSGVELV